MTHYRSALAVAITEQGEKGIEATVNAIDRIRPCSVDGCTNKAIVGETVQYRGFTVWTYICGQHMIDRRHAGL